MASNLLLMVYLFSIISWLFIALYVGQDASKRNRNVYFWFISSLIFGVIAAVIYSISITPRGNLQNTIDKQSPNQWNSPTGIQREREWNYTIERENYNQDPILNVTDGRKDATFIIRKDKIEPQSQVYQRKYGDEWIEEAKKYLRDHFSR